MTNKEKSLEIFKEVLGKYERNFTLHYSQDGEGLIYFNGKNIEESISQFSSWKECLEIMIKLKKVIKTLEVRKRPKQDDFIKCWKGSQYGNSLFSSRSDALLELVRDAVFYARFSYKEII